MFIMRTTPHPYLLSTLALILAASCSVQNTSNNAQVKTNRQKNAAEAGAQTPVAPVNQPAWAAVNRAQLEGFGLSSVKDIQSGRLSLVKSQLTVESLSAQASSPASPAPNPVPSTSLQQTGCQNLLTAPGAQLNAFGGRAETSASGSSQSLLALKNGQLTWQAKAGAQEYARLKISLYARDLDRQHLALDPDAELNLWLSGAPATKLILKVADAESEAKKAVITIGSLEDWLSDELGPKRQRVRIPVSEISELADSENMASLELQVQGGEINLDGLAIGSCQDQAPVSAVSKPGRALWVLNTQEKLDQLNPSDKLASWFHFLRDQRISTVFLQLPNSKNCKQAEVCFDTPALRQLVSRLHERNIQVQAMTGAPDSIFEPNKTGVLKTVKNLLAYNQAAPAKSRFDGLQLNAEIHRLYAFHSPEQNKLWTQYLDLLYTTKMLLTSAALKLNVVIPAWLDQRDSVSQQPYILSYEGQTLPLLEHLLPAADELALIANRTALTGKGNLLDLSLHELRLAHNQGRKVWIGLETADMSSTQLAFNGKPTAGWPKDNNRAAIVSQGDGDQTRLLYLPPQHSFSPPPGALSLWHWPVVSKKELNGNDQSFARLSRKQFNQTEQQLNAALQGWDSYAGLAVHEATGFNTLMSKSP